jgi:NADH-quinone oxidoreductase subunit M
MLYLYRRVIFGTLTKDNLKKILDLSPREMAVFAPLVLLVFWMGLYPAPFLEVMHVSVGNLLDRVETARAAIETATVLGR